MISETYTSSLWHILHYFAQVNRKLSIDHYEQSDKSQTGPSAVSYLRDFNASDPTLDVGDLWSVVVLILHGDLDPGGVRSRLRPSVTGNHSQHIATENGEIHISGCLVRC